MGNSFSLYTPLAEWSFMSSWDIANWVVGFGIQIISAISEPHVHILLRYDKLSWWLLFTASRRFISKVNLKPKGIGSIWTTHTKF